MPSPKYCFTANGPLLSNFTENVFLPGSSSQSSPSPALRLNHSHGHKSLRIILQIILT